MRACENYSVALSQAVFYSGISQLARTPLRSQPVHSQPTASLPTATPLHYQLVRAPPRCQLVHSPPIASLSTASLPTASPLRPQLVRNLPTASLPMASQLARAMLRRQLASETRRGRNFMRTSEPYSTAISTAQSSQLVCIPLHQQLHTLSTL